MKLPERIYLVQPYPDTADCEWCEDPGLFGVKKEEATLYVRADFVCGVLNDYKKVTELLDSLERE